MQRWRREKSVAPNPVRGHRGRLLDAHAEWLLELIDSKSDLTLAEIRAKLKKRGVRVSRGDILGPNVDTDDKSVSARYLLS
jgi:putative transposase